MVIVHAGFGQGRRFFWTNKHDRHYFVIEITQISSRLHCTGEATHLETRLNGHDQGL